MQYWKKYYTSTGRSGFYSKADLIQNPDQQKSSKLKLLEAKGQFLAFASNNGLLEMKISILQTHAWHKYNPIL